MMHNRIKNWFFGLISLIFLGILTWIAFKNPDWLLYYGLLTCLPGYLLLLVCLTPIGSICLGDASQRVSCFKWWGELLKGHCVLILFTFVVFVGFFGGSPTFMKPMNFVAALEEVQRYTHWEWGIFPWGIYGLWAIGIAYMVYVKKAPPYLYSLARGLFPKSLEPMAKTMVEGVQFSATALVIAIVVVAITLTFSYGFEKYYRVSHFTLAPITMSFFSIFVIFFSLKSTRFGIRHRSHWLSMAHLVSFCIILLTGILIIAAFANQWFVTRYIQLVEQSTCHRCGTYFENVLPSMRFAGLYWGWWMIWTPLAGSYLAYISKGRTVRAFIIGLFSFPLMFWLFGKIILVSFSSQASYSFSSLPIIYGCLIIAPFIAWWVLARMLKKVYHSDFFQSGYMPLEADFPRSRLSLEEGTKSVGIGRYSIRVLMLIFGTLIFQTIAGWYGLQIQVMPIAFFVINAVYAALCFFLFRLFKNP